MGLLALGLVRRDEVATWGAVDRRTKGGKLIARMSEGGSTLFREGTDLTDLTNLLSEIFRTDLEVIPFSGSGVACRSFVREHIPAGNPVVLGLQWEDDGHWVLVIGLDSSVDGTEREVCRFMVLDSSQPPSPVCPWNGIVDARGSGGRYPYRWWTDAAAERQRLRSTRRWLLSPEGAGRVDRIAFKLVV
jgi:hypothetical protein